MLPVVRRTTAATDDALGSRQLAPDLHLGYAFVDGTGPDGGARPVTVADVIAMDIDPAVLRGHALSNLSQRPYTIDGDGPVFRLTADDGGEAAGYLALADMWRGLATAMQGDLVAVAPRQHELWFSDSRIESIDLLLGAASAAHRGADDALSQALLVHADGSWLELRAELLDIARDTVAHDVPVAFSMALPQIALLEEELPGYLPDGTTPSPPGPPGAAIVQIVVVDAGKPQPRALPDGTTALTLVDRRLRYEVDGLACTDRRDLRQRLVEIFADRSRWPQQMEDLADSRRGPWLRVDPQRGVRYGDVVEIVEVARQAGFERIDYGVQGWR